MLKDIGWNFLSLKYSNNSERLHNWKSALHLRHCPHFSGLHGILDLRALSSFGVCHRPQAVTSSFPRPYSSTVFISCLGNHPLLRSPVKWQLWGTRGICILCSDRSAPGPLTSVWLKQVALPMRALPQTSPWEELPPVGRTRIPNVHLALQPPTRSLLPSASEGKLSFHFSKATRAFSNLVAFPPPTFNFTLPAPVLPPSCQEWSGSYVSS